MKSLRERHIERKQRAEDNARAETNYGPDATNARVNGSTAPEVEDDNEDGGNEDGSGGSGATGNGAGVGGLDGADAAKSAAKPAKAPKASPGAAQADAQANAGGPLPSAAGTQNTDGAAAAAAAQWKPNA